MFCTFYFYVGHGTSKISCISLDITKYQMKEKTVERVIFQIDHVWLTAVLQIVCYQELKWNCKTKGSYSEYCSVRTVVLIQSWTRYKLVRAYFRNMLCKIFAPWTITNHWKAHLCAFLERIYCLFIVFCPFSRVSYTMEVYIFHIALGIRLAYRLLTD